MPWIQYSKTRCLIEILWRPNPAKPYSSKVPRRIPEIPLLLELVGTMSFLWKALKKLIDTFANTKKFTCWKLLSWFNGLPVHLSYIKKVQQQNLQHQKSPTAKSPTSKKSSSIFYIHVSAFTRECLYTRVLIHIHVHV